MKLTLLHKGLILVSIPLCFEVTIFGYLLNLQMQVEKEAQRINHNKMINDEVHLMMCDIIGISDTIQGYDVDSRLPLPARIAGIRQRLSDVMERLSHLRELAKDDPKMLQKVNACSAGLTAARNELLRMGRSIDGSLSDAGQVLAQSKRVLNADVHYSLKSGLLELGEASFKATSDDTSRQIRERMRLLLKCALGFSVLFALLCAGLFSRNMASRLARLSQNAHLLAKGETLLAPIKGSDEVAELDRSFHYAADLIQAARKMRQEVTAMITHDLKTPLQSIRGYLEMLESGLFGDLNEQGTRLLATSSLASEHMVNLIDSVLQLEKLRTGNVKLKSESIEMASFMDRCVKLVSGFADSRGVLIILHDESKDEGIVSGDAFWLQEVFVNILSNAVKFTRENTEVIVETKVWAGNVETSITDHGPGISQEECKYIFERFQRAQSAEGIAGSGLGLAIAKELVEMHHGSIAVNSEIGQGSTFTIKLPMSKSVTRITT